MPGHLMRAPALPVPQFSLASLDSRAQNELCGAPRRLPSHKMAGSSSGHVQIQLTLVQFSIRDSSLPTTLRLTKNTNKVFIVLISPPHLRDSSLPTTLRLTKNTNKFSRVLISPLTSEIRVYLAPFLAWLPKNTYVRFPVFLFHLTHHWNGIHSSEIRVYLAVHSYLFIPPYGNRFVTNKRRDSPTLASCATCRYIRKTEEWWTGNRGTIHHMNNSCTPGDKSIQAEEEGISLRKSMSIK